MGRAQIGRIDQENGLASGSRRGQDRSHEIGPAAIRQPDRVGGRGIGGDPAGISGHVHVEGTGDDRRPLTVPTTALPRLAGPLAWRTGAPPRRSRSLGQRFLDAERSSFGPSRESRERVPNDVDDACVQPHDLITDGFGVSGGSTRSGPPAAAAS